MLGHSAAYIPTHNTSPSAQASRARRWSYSVFDEIRCSNLGLPSVVGQEGLLEFGLGAFEVDQLVSRELLHHRVEGRLRRAAGQLAVANGHVANPGQGGEGGGVDGRGKPGAHVMH